jgi:hypothetical protein
MLTFKQFISRGRPEKYEGPDRRVGPRRTKSAIPGNVVKWGGRRTSDQSMKEHIGLEEIKKDPCWNGYKMLGMKKKGNKEVPNCIPEAAVDAKGYKSSTGGLTQKGRDHYNSQSGGNLKAPVTTPPSELKAGSKAANRRKSFCARMGGVEGPMRKPNGEPTRKALALRKWNC